MGGNGMPRALGDIRLASLGRCRIECRHGQGILIRRNETVAAAEDEIVLAVDKQNRPGEVCRRRNDASQREQDSQRIRRLTSDLFLEDVLVVVWVPVKGKLDAGRRLLRQEARGQASELRRQV